MPPKAKFTREEITEAALQIVREDGFSALTARALGERLGSSPRPVFTVFQSMDEVQQSVMAAARACYAGYVAQGLETAQPFKGVGVQYIRFAVEEPKLFQLLFMAERENVPDLGRVLPLIEENYETIFRSVQREYGMSEARAEKLYRHLWIYTHGIAALCAARTCRFSGAEISEMITEVCSGLLKKWEDDGCD